MPELPQGLGTLPEVLQDGIEGLLDLVDTKVNWILPNRWVWIPGTYEWNFESAEGETPIVKTRYHLTLGEDSTMTYSWYSMEKTKKMTEHEMRLDGTWQGPERKVVEETSTSEESSTQTSTTVDIITLLPTRIAFERRITGSTNKTVTIKTKTEDGFLPIQLGEGFIQVSAPRILFAATDRAPALLPFRKPFELQFQVKLLLAS